MTRVGAAFACIVRSLALAALWFALGAGAATASPPEIFTSLEQPPTTEDVRAAVARGVTIFEFDLETPGSQAAIAAVKQAKGSVTAYHIGGGGGRDWGSVRTGEWVRRYDSPRDFLALTADVKQLVALGADAIHFDNTHRFSGRRLESIADAIVAGGARFVAKNNPEKWNLVMQRRADLKPIYAVIEDAMFDASETQAAFGLHARGVPVYIIGFTKPLDPKTPALTEEYVRAYRDNNPWAALLIIDDERAWDSRSGRFVR